jgi:capsular polysaccharide biosynthesis protein
MELLEYWKIIRKRLWLILLLMLLAGSVAGYYASQQVPLYRTSTTLFINPGQVSPMVPGEFTRSSNDLVESLANTYTQLINTRSFVQRVAEELGDEVSPGGVKGALSASYQSGTQFYRITATHPDPEMAQDIANTAAQVLIASADRGAH